ncbi:MAG: HI0074 family nucleotidyltransferase substrate-binding subunit [Lachnospiraceae bacterium]|nr:HI0074 family nucleotidyltransferase substrate-binding subunit [Lachnospiraceae bacterium]
MKRFDQYQKHLETLKKAHQEDLENEFIISGVIDKFFIQFELGWKVLKQLLQYEGESIARSGSPREIIKASYACFDFMDEEMWLRMLQKRNDTTHIYNEEAARQLVGQILELYIQEFDRMSNAVQARYGKILEEIP